MGLYQHLQQDILKYCDFYVVILKVRDNIHIVYLYKSFLDILFFDNILCFLFKHKFDIFK